MKKYLLLLVAILCVPSCTWVKVSSEGAGISLLAADEVTNCQRLGQTHSQTMDKIAFVKRSKRKQTEELVKLAKNEAANMGGNAVVAVADIVDGRQTFIIYQCN